jgi:hypothetical protein
MTPAGLLVQTRAVACPACGAEAKLIVYASTTPGGGHGPYRVAKFDCPHQLLGEHAPVPEEQIPTLA